MHHLNDEWFRNCATNNYLALQAPNTLSMQRASNLITDVGICVGMLNVNLKGEATCLMNNIPHYCKYSVPLPLIPPNWYNNYAQYLHRDDIFTKYYQTPQTSYGMNTLVVNEYSSARDEMFKVRQSFSTMNSISPIGDLKNNGMYALLTPTSNPVTVLKDEILDPTLAPPKKKWIRHYMMGEYDFVFFFFKLTWN